MTGFRPRLLLAACVAFGAGMAHASPVAGTPEGLARCAVSSDIRGFTGDLSHARDAIRDGKALVIVTLGSSSTAGSGASSEANTYPAVLEAELARLLPGHEIRVINRGVGGQSATQMYHRIEDEVLSESPALVIWQTGVNDAIQDVGLDRFRRILRKGVAEIRAGGADVLFMDHQPIPRMERYPFYTDYLHALRDVGAEIGAPVYRRFDVMRSLLVDGRLKEEELFSRDNLHQVDASYYCVGVTLARSIAEKVSARPLETVRR